MSTFDQVFNIITGEGDFKSLPQESQGFINWWKKNKPQSEEAQVAHILICFCAFQAGYYFAKESETSNKES